MKQKEPRMIFLTPSALPNGRKRDGVPGGWMYYDGTTEPYDLNERHFASMMRESRQRMHDDFVMKSTIEAIERSDHPDYIKSVLCKYVGGKR